MIGGLAAGSFGAIVHPGVFVGHPVGMPLGTSSEELLIRTVVDTHLHLPDMFELTFVDEAGSLTTDAGIEIGTVIEIKAGKETDTTTTSLIVGEVTSIEALCQDNVIFTVVRGYERAHRLQRATRTRTFVNMTDSDIARQVASAAGLQIDTIDPTSTTHNHVAQVAQTDWDFLTQRAREIGFETGVAGNKFFFRAASGSAAAGGGLAGAAASAAASAIGLDSGTLMFKDNLLSFFPRISAANITTEVEVRMWDSKDARVVTARADAASGTATIDGQEPGRLAGAFTDGFLPPLPSVPALPPIPGLPRIDFGSAPSSTAHLVVDRPVGYGAAADRAAEEVARSLAEHVASTFAEAEGDAMGDPAIQAGAQVDIDGVPKQFAGKWTVTNARHVFDVEENGYHTRFWVSGRQNRNLLGLTSGGAREERTRFGGLVCGVVTNVSDPDKLGRVKVALPWLSPSFESDWARVAQVGAGPRSGALFLPEVGDEVLIGFEFGDPRRGYVLGGLINSNSDYGALTTAVGSSGAVNERGIASPAGNRLQFTDDLPPGPPGPPPIKSAITLGTKDDKLGLVIDQVAGTVTLSCNPAPPASKTPAGALTIECGDLGGITIKGGTGGVKVETDGQLELNGKLGVKIASDGLVEVSGSLIKLN